MDLSEVQMRIEVKREVNDDLKLSLCASLTQWIEDPVSGEMKFHSFLFREVLW
jgi:hypothetical protein